MIAHLDHGTRLHARIPFPFNIVGSKYEYVLMKVLGKLTDMDWIYRHRITRSLVDTLANRAVLPLIHGEVLNPDEVVNMVSRLEADEDRCHGCAQCQAYCPNGAVRLVPRAGHSLSYCPPDLLGYAGHEDAHRRP
ncbi:MAG: 4Fe-4S binding protein [Actinobacteria bacterium]|nr:4Fe-4S binding protein [Actinomycetota bacterium]MDI6832078.1 4Fe-4S binding protein [Actinomycetota bacterium]